MLNTLTVLSAEPVTYVSSSIITRENMSKEWVVFTFWSGNKKDFIIFLYFKIKSIE